MATRNIAYSITQTHQHETEAKPYAESANRRAGEHCATAGQQNQKHGAEHFGEILFHIKHS